MDVRPPEGVRQPRPVEPRKVEGKVEKKAPERPLPPSDKVEISETARLVSKALSLPSIRPEVVKKARADLEAGKYERREVLEKAVERFIREEAGDILREV
jgi:hypothetical protein